MRASASATWPGAAGYYAAYVIRVRKIFEDGRKVKMVRSLSMRPYNNLPGAVSEEELVAKTIVLH